MWEDQVSIVKKVRPPRASQIFGQDSEGSQLIKYYYYYYYYYYMSSSQL